MAVPGAAAVVPATGSKSSQAAGTGACTKAFSQGARVAPVELRKTGHMLTDCIRGAQVNFGLFYGGMQ